MLTKWASNETCPNCRLIIDCEILDNNCQSFFNIPTLSDSTIGAILFFVALIILSISLLIFYKSFTKLLPLIPNIRKFANPQFSNMFGRYFYSYLFIFTGAFLMLIFPSSITISCILVIVSALDILNVENIYPMIIGSNFGESIYFLMLNSITLPRHQRSIRSIQVRLKFLNCLKTIKILDSTQIY